MSENIKYAGLTILEWEQLDNLAYVTIKVSLFDDYMFLDDYQGEYDDIEELSSDPRNMERVNLDLPDNIKIELILHNGDKAVVITPLLVMAKRVVKYYRILGVANLKGKKI